MYSLRLFFVGGLISFRALFSWFSPWIYVPTLLVAPIFQILLFANLGRAAGVGSDAFFLIGNALQFVAAPCVFAMTRMVAGERLTQTLAIVLTSPAGRLPIFLGRSVPVLLNGGAVAMFSLPLGAVLLDVEIPGTAWWPIILVVMIAVTACTGLGMVIAALALRLRETSVLSNITFGVLLIFSGANVPLSALPAWMAEIGALLPLSNAIDATRELAAGGELPDVAVRLLREAGIGVLYFVVGFATLCYFERRSRRTASLERS